MEKTPLRLFKKTHLIENGTPCRIPSSPLMTRLGYGTGVAVYLMNGSSKKSKTSASPWAIKKCLKDKHKTDKTYARRLAEEADILRALSHPNIVGFRAYTKADDGRFTLAMEACTVSLGDLIETRCTANLGPLEVKHIVTMGYDISNALSYLHNEALLIHGDMKSFNILIKGDFSICKLCDFGVSIPIKEDGLVDFEKKPNAVYIGTDLWNAPEVFEEEPELISTKTEIFSFGLVLYECVTLSPPHMLEMKVDSKKALNFDDIENEEDNVDEDNETDDLDCMVGTRPLFPENMKLPKAYNDILQIFYICTDEHPENRPDAKHLEIIFKEIKIA